MILRPRILPAPHSWRHWSAQYRENFSLTKQPSATTAAETFRASEFESIARRFSRARHTPFRFQESIEMTFKIWGTENTINHKIGVDYDAITMLPTGGYVVTWRENNKIAFQLYDGNGTTDNITRFVEASGTGLTQQFSDVFAYDSDGGFVITWIEGNGTTGRTLKN